MKKLFLVGNFLAEFHDSIWDDKDKAEALAFHLSNKSGLSYSVEELPFNELGDYAAEYKNED